MGRGLGTFVLLVFALGFIAAVFEVLTGIDLDAFEARTGFFDWIGTAILNLILAVFGLIGALAAASVISPRRFGPSMGMGCGVLGFLVALFVLYVFIALGGM